MDVLKSNLLQDVFRDAKLLVLLDVQILIRVDGKDILVQINLRLA